MKKFLSQLWHAFIGYLTASDKWLHLAVVYAICFLICPFSQAWAFSVAMAAAVGKEVYDYLSGKGTPEVWDFFFGVIGAGLALLSYNYVLLFLLFA